GQLVEDGQPESGRLAGAGLRAAHHVASGKDDGDGLRLNGGGLGVAGLGHGPQDLGPQAELLKARRAQTTLLNRGLPRQRFPVQAAHLTLVEIAARIVVQPRNARRSAGAVTGTAAPWTLL